MNFLRKAACAAALIAATSLAIGCGNTFRPIAAPLPVTSGNPAGAETEVVLNQCPTGSVCKDAAGATSASILTSIDVSGDTNEGNQPLQNQVASQVGPVAFSMASPMAFDASRTSVYTANTENMANPANPTDSVSQLLLGSSTAGFAATTNTISLETGSKPIGISFEYFGVTYTQDYVVNSGMTATCPTGGSLGAISQATATLKATICLGANADPVFAWIYKDQSKVFVLDYSLNQVYVVSASKYEVTNTITLPAGSGPIKMAQSNNGQYLYVLNSNGTISIIDGQAETVLGTITTNDASSPLIDIAQDLNFNDTTANTQINHVWILHADGTVEVYDGTAPGQLHWITSIATITPAQLASGVYPTNLALLRDGTWAYVGLGTTDQIVAINTSRLASGAVTQNATSSVTVGVHRSVSVTLTNNIPPGPPVSGNVLVETTTPTVNSVAVSREGNSADLAKVYATTTTDTTYYCYDETVTPTDCANNDPWVNGTPIGALPPAVPFLVAGCSDLGLISSGPAAGLFGMSCPNLYNGTSVVTAAAIGASPGIPAKPVNTYIKTIPAPAQITYCDVGNPATGEYDGQKNCPAMIPVMVLGRS